MVPSKFKIKMVETGFENRLNRKSVHFFMEILFSVQRLQFLRLKEVDALIQIFNDLFFSYVFKILQGGNLIKTVMITKNRDQHCR